MFQYVFSILQTIKFFRHHVRHIKAYDPKEGKVCFKNDDLCFSFENDGLCFSFFAKICFHRTTSVVWPEPTRLRRSTTSLPAWQTGVASVYDLVWPRIWPGVASVHIWPGVTWCGKQGLQHSDPSGGGRAGVRLPGGQATKQQLRSLFGGYHSIHLTLHTA